MNLMSSVLYILFILLIIHLLTLLIFNFIINPGDPSFFIKIFPYHFLHNLAFSKYKLDKNYFSIRLDIDTSHENVKSHNEGVLKLIKLADKHGIPITFSVASEYIPDLSDDVKELMMEAQHEIITHGHSHSDITDQDQNDQLNISKQLLENTFNKTVKGMVAPQAKHDMNTLKAAKKNGIEYISAGTLSYIRYWSFPYPFKKNGIWLIGGSIPSDHFLYHQKGKRPEDALEIWKSALIHRSKKGWFTQLEYHNFSTSEEELNALEKLFQFISNKKDLEPITQGQFIERIEERV